MTKTQAISLNSLLIFSVSSRVTKVDRLMRMISEFRDVETKAVDLLRLTSENDAPQERKIARLNIAKGITKNPDLVIFQLKL